MSQFSFKNRYLDLGDSFYEKRRPSAVEKPGLIQFNKQLAAELGLPELMSDEFLAQTFSGNRIHKSCEPLAMAYAGHQFGHFNPQLGDGRAIYLGELCTGESCMGKSCMDIQLKGSGQTRYSRNGDGRAALGPVLREYLVSEAMYALGVPTTRALAAVSTGEPVARERLLPGGVITRAAESFIRVGSFEYFAMQGDFDSVRKLADYVIERNYPELAESESPYQNLLQAVALRQASLIAKWMQLGFIHGVMNTDNMSVAGETIDYGPCAFMDYYEHDKVYSSIDEQGRYAYNNQPSIGLWNLSRFAETLLPLFADNPDNAVNQAQAILQKYIERYEHEWLQGMKAKCGLCESSGVNADDDKKLIESLLKVLDENNADFTLSFYYLSQLQTEPGETDAKLHELFSNQQDIEAWLNQWRARLSAESLSDEARQASMRQVNPVYIPRNHQIEAVIRAAEDNNDFEPFHQLHRILSNPFTLQANCEEYMQPPAPEQIVRQTFCGT